MKLIRLNPAKITVFKNQINTAHQHYFLGLSESDFAIMQMGFMPGRGTTDAIFIMRQFLEKYEMAGRDLYIWYLWIVRKPLIMFQER